MTSNVILGIFHGAEISRYSGRFEATKIERETSQADVQLSQMGIL